MKKERKSLHYLFAVGFFNDVQTIMVIPVKNNSLVAFKTNQKYSTLTFHIKFWVKQPCDDKICFPLAGSMIPVNRELILCHGKGWPLIQLIVSSSYM